MHRIPEGYDAHVEHAVTAAARCEGYLTDREARFLCLLAAVPTTAGEVLEIGSFKGNSTVVLAKSARLAGDDRIVAVDPLTSPAATDPSLKGAESGLEEFRTNLRANHVEQVVEFHQMPSQDLARSWDRQIRLLWIDGDHTYTGVKTDFEMFSPFLSPGAIVAFHDVLHPFEGPVRILVENLLLSDRFGACGVCGSIGWSQYLGDPEATQIYQEKKLRLHKQLSRLVPHVALGRRINRRDRLVYHLQRSLVPPRRFDPTQWVQTVQFFHRAV
jgi:predicted O-methyltransferase YrrM